MLRGTGEAGGLCRAPLRCPRGFSGGPGPLRAPPPVCVWGLGTPRGLWVAPRGRGRAPFCGWADAVFQPVMSSAGIASRETSSGEAEEAKPSRNPSGAAPVRGYPLLPPPPLQGRQVNPAGSAAPGRRCGRQRPGPGHKGRKLRARQPGPALPRPPQRCSDGDRRRWCRGGAAAEPCVRLPRCVCVCLVCLFRCSGRKIKSFGPSPFFTGLFVISGSKNLFLIGYGYLSRP